MDHQVPLWVFQAVGVALVGCVVWFAMRLLWRVDQLEERIVKMEKAIAYAHLLEIENDDTKHRS